MAKKTYYLFGIKIWSVIVELDPDQDSEDTEEEDTTPVADGGLSASTTISDGNPPPFGFTPWTPDFMDWED